MKRAIWWIKRDFRLSDNQALTQALQACDEVLPLFIYETGLIEGPDSSPMHLWAWQTALKDLREKTQSLGGDILIRTGAIENILETLKTEYNFSHIYSHEETGNGWTFTRDKTVGKWCKRNKIYWTEYPQTGVIRGLKSRVARTPIIEARLYNQKPLPVPTNLKFPANIKPLLMGQIPLISDFFDLKNFPSINFNKLQVVSESQARADFKSFLNDRGFRYSGGISSPNTAFVHGSRLSVHLAWGTLTLRQAFAGVAHKVKYLNAHSQSEHQQWLRSLKGFCSRLHWHDHFIQRLESEPSMEFKPLNQAYEKIQYQNNPEFLTAWHFGKTGFPMVDACMRCLQATGFLNFRMRSMVVSFATFGLHLDWRYIRDPLAQIFLDYEPGIHFSQLQMQAGIVGINTIRVYSPTKQIEDQDPECKFIKQWIPELKAFTPTEIKSYESFSLGDYPPPIINFKANVKGMKDQVFAIRKSSEGQSHSRRVLDKHGSKKKRRQPTKAQKTDSQLTLFEL